MSDPRQTANPEICAQWDWCPYCKNGLDTGLQCDQCLADLMPVQEALRELQRLRADHARLTEQAEGWRKDAERYRWLRDNADPADCDIYLASDSAFVSFRASAVDASIDAAIDASREGK